VHAANLTDKLGRERTLVLIKPDGIVRGIVGKILARFERAGLKIVAMKLACPTREFAAGHYSGSRDWLEGMGKKTLDSFSQFGLDVNEIMGTDEPLEIGKMVQDWLVDYLADQPIVSVVLEGVHAISSVRRLIGFTIPCRAEPGTIRGDWAIDSNTIANIEKRATKNLVHASGDEGEARHEIEYWFKENEIIEYERCDRPALF